MRDFGWIIILVGAALWSVPFAAAHDAPVPVGLSPEEVARDRAAGLPDRVDDPPEGDVVSPAEWAEAEGVFVAWMWSSFYPYLADLVEAVTDAGVTCWVVVSSASQQSAASAYLTSQGVSLENVEFMIESLDTLWIVDYGPFFVTVDGAREIIDHMYPGRPLDDVFPLEVADAWSLAAYTSDLRIEGGNFISDGLGTCFITEFVYEQNAGFLSQQEVRDRLRDYCGCETVHSLDYLADYTGHIDMFAKLLDEETMLIGQYEPGDPEYAILEDNATLVAGLTAPTGNPYDVVRIPMPGAPGDYWTYTNSLFVGDHVLVPTYGAPEDAVALTTYETALPECTVVGIDSSVPIAWGGAVHCTTKVVPQAEETPTPAPTATAEIPSPTVRPTPPPSPTSGPASPTPEPVPGVRLELPRRVHPGEVFRVRGLLDCPGPAMEDVPVVFLLDVHGSYWFWPSWCRYAPPEAEEWDCCVMDVPSGTTPVEVVPTFTWPDTGDAEVGGLYFYGAMLEADFSAVRGGMASEQWGYGPAS